MWQALRRAGKVTAWLVLSLLVATVTALVALLLYAHTNRGQRRILNAIVPRVQQSLSGRLTVGRLSGNLTRELVLNDVRLYDREGELAISIRRLHATYELSSLLQH